MTSQTLRSKHLTAVPGIVHDVAVRSAVAVRVMDVEVFAATAAAAA